MTNETPAAKAEEQLSVWSEESRGISRIADIVFDEIEEIMTSEFAAPNDDWSTVEVDEYIANITKQLAKLVATSITK